MARSCNLSQSGTNGEAWRTHRTAVPVPRHSGRSDLPWPAPGGARAATARPIRAHAPSRRAGPKIGGWKGPHRPSPQPFLLKFLFREEKNTLLPDRRAEGGRVHPVSTSLLPVRVALRRHEKHAFPAGLFFSTKRKQEKENGAPVLRFLSEAIPASRLRAHCTGRIVCGAGAVAGGHAPGGICRMAAPFQVDSRSMISEQIITRRLACSPASTVRSVRTAVRL